MLFRRREPESRWARFLTFLWPRRSFRRSYRYFLKRVIRLDAEPHAVAAGFAAGVIASFTPFVGFHFIMAFAIAFILAGNMAAAALGTAVGNPATFPFIWGATYELGRYLTEKSPGRLPQPMALESSLSPWNLFAIWEPVVKPMLIGSIPLGLVAGGISYGIVRAAVTSFQAHRRRRILAGRRAPDQAGETIVGKLAGPGKP
ncbi:DUF2062 domain-containing protein [Jiella sp. MQZ9-1]|uniref:DUF2062 domain-containing protein n=1 Tax=Jiella flava TaxID=2816857 RepID=A0A939JUI5_9HYPH|nr:DUF2062 domain-containing protein [Jiella flava]MBO0663215.1 DUF2062 domain-containing protein [Jiella flava]MCD2471790.1 DUF2062 domain-containing protein [Jiella flava]